MNRILGRDPHRLVAAAVALAIGQAGPRRDRPRRNHGDRAQASRVAAGRTIRDQRAERGGAAECRREQYGGHLQERRRLHGPEPWSGPKPGRLRGVSGGKTDRDLPGVKEQVGVYMDESVISLSLFTPDLELYDLNRVEVLRGPQGTLFGSGSVGGTVRYISNEPDLSASYGDVEVTGSSIDGGGTGGNVSGMFNMPMGNTAALRVVGYYSDIPGFIDAVQPGGTVNEDVNGGTRYGVRAAMV